MNERGFFTLTGICFLIVASILVIGLQETSRNYINVSDSFKTETELQNIADSALIVAIEKIDNKEIPLETIDYDANRDKKQFDITGDIIDDIDTMLDEFTDITVLYEYGIDRNHNGTIHFIDMSYSSGKQTYGKLKKFDEKILREEGVILISVASRKIDDDTTIYRRSMAYVKENEQGELDFKTIYFMNSLKDD